MKHAFEYEGHTVLEASNGYDAICLLKSIQKPAVIFLDIHMPVMDGNEFIKLLRSDEKLCDIPVVVMTAGGDLNDFKLANRSIKKPFELDELLDVARTFCCTSRIVD